MPSPSSRPLRYGRPSPRSCWPYSWQIGSALGSGTRGVYPPMPKSYLALWRQEHRLSPDQSRSTITRARAALIEEAACLRRGRKPRGEPLLVSSVDPTGWHSVHISTRFAGATCGIRLTRSSRALVDAAIVGEQATPSPAVVAADNTESTDTTRATSISAMPGRLVNDADPIPILSRSWTIERICRHW